MAKRRGLKWNFKSLRRNGVKGIRLVLKGAPLVLMAVVIGFVFFEVRAMLQADPYFHVERITVFPSGVLSQAEYQFLETKTSGHSLFDVDLKGISEVLERNPVVKRAEVSRSLPNELNIVITTRLPFVQIQLKSGGPYYLVSEDQLVLTVQDVPRTDLLKVEDLSASKKSYAVGMFFGSRYFRSLLRALQTVKADAVLAKESISKVTSDDAGNISLILADGVELKVGDPFSLSQNMRSVLGSLLTSKERNQILYVDLRYQDMIVKRK
ncbi:MAG: FtsQ-type POTRA domain-containing protein [Candidatus Omnitrophica bacterium]|nr:FtsQ-type POTRA domain-containing protein [Candidatus Omnitrophota bacterium]